MKKLVLLPRACRYYCTASTADMKMEWLRKLNYKSRKQREKCHMAYSAQESYAQTPVNTALSGQPFSARWQGPLLAAVHLNRFWPFDAYIKRERHTPTKRKHPFRSSSIESHRGQLWITKTEACLQQCFRDSGCNTRFSRSLFDNFERLASFYRWVQVLTRCFSWLLYFHFGAL